MVVVVVVVAMETSELEASTLDTELEELKELELETGALDDSEARLELESV